jgi:hypothetical protein
MAGRCRKLEQAAAAAERAEAARAREWQEGTQQDAPAPGADGEAALSGDAGAPALASGAWLRSSISLHAAVSGARRHAPLSECFFKIESLAWLQAHPAAARTSRRSRARRERRVPARQRSARSRAGATRSGLRWGRCWGLGTMMMRATMTAWTALRTCW